MSSDLYNDSYSGAMGAQIRLDLAFAISMSGVFLMNVPGWRWAPPVLAFGGGVWVWRELLTVRRHLRPGEKWNFSRGVDELEQHIYRKADAAAHWVLILACLALDGASRLWPSRPELHAFRGLWALLFAVRWLTSAIVRWRYR
jgi:hypothetical protein